jgi:uncharacterized SAM-binding protein YcdF (DUF218 family)
LDTVTKPRPRNSNARVAKRTFFGMVVALLAGTFLLATPLPQRLLFDGLQIYSPLSPEALASETSGPPAAIVILSAGQRLRVEYGNEFGNQAPDGLSLERVRYGAFVARKTGLPVLVSGGSLDADKPALAKVLADMLRFDYGMEPKWMEDHSANTAENAMFSAKMLKEAGITHVLLVTHAWHMKRAVAAFSANGMTVTPAPTGFYLPGRKLPLASVLDPSVSGLLMSSYALHEIIGSLWYKVKYGY